MLKLRAKIEFSPIQASMGSCVASYFPLPFPLVLFTADSDDVAISPHKRARKLTMVVTHRSFGNG